MYSKTSFLSDSGLISSIIIQPISVKAHSTSIKSCVLLYRFNFEMRRIIYIFTVWDDNQKL